MAGYSGRNRPAADGGPQGVQRSYASQLKEREPTFHTYEHLAGLERGESALIMLRKVASMVKPIMVKRNWKVQILAEFLPPEQNLLGLNINRGYKICIRLRYHNNPDLFLPMEQVIDTLLHELSHNVWGPHDANFHRLWDELRDEQETLIRKGYTGEGFLSEGKRLGGRPAPPPHEMRRLARASAEKRRTQNKLTKGSGQRLGGTPLHLQGGDVRNVIANQITRRNTINQGCGSGRSDAVRISDEASNHTFKTQAEEDDANNRAIMQALYDLMEEEEERKLRGAFSAAPTDGGLAWDPEAGLYDPKKERLPELNGSHPHQPSEAEQLEWALQESIRAEFDDEDRGNLLFENGKEDTDLSSAAAAAPPPPVPVESKPSPVSATTISRPTSAKSPISPLTPHRDESGSIKRKRTATDHQIAEPSSAPSSIRAESERSPVIDLSEPFHPSSTPSDQWACDICTCVNPLQFLACDACGTERPQRIGIGNRGARPKPQHGLAVPVLAPARSQSLGWICHGCGAFMEHKWWTCSACGKMKESS